MTKSNEARNLSVTSTSCQLNVSFFCCMCPLLRCGLQPLAKSRPWDAGLARKVHRDALANNDDYLSSLFRCARRTA